jgi:carboxymethylenebutenolidase
MSNRSDTKPSGILKEDNIGIGYADGQLFNAYSVSPEAPVDRAVVVLQEIFGVTEKIRGYCRRFAEQGYLSVAPDLFWRLEPGTDLPYTEEGIAKARSCLARFSIESALVDIRACCDDLRGRKIKHISLVGFCLGGRLSAAALTQGMADSAVSFYGVGLEAYRHDLASLTRPIQFHFGDKDPHIPPNVVSEIVDISSRNEKLSVHRYENASHAFFRQDVSDDDSKLAFKRTLEFLEGTNE